MEWDIGFRVVCRKELVAVETLSPLMGLVTVNDSELMTGLGNVIPTEKPPGFDEESRVGTSQSS